MPSVVIGFREGRSLGGENVGLREGVVSWLKRLPPDYRRRFYANLAVLAGVIGFFVLFAHSNAKAQLDEVEALMALSLAWTFFMPLVRFLLAPPGRGAWIFYALWLTALGVAALSIVVRLPGIVSFASLVAGTVLMIIFYVVYAKRLLPSFFSGSIGERWRTARAAQKAEREERLRDLGF
jgi:hypothetical protein